MNGLDRFDREPHTHGRGRAAEEDGVAWLEGQGYRVLDRNVATRAGEIDAVALDNGTLCFVEIKARSSDRYGPAIGAVTRQQQTRLGRAAALYLVGKPWEGPCRFDVLGLDPSPEGWRYTLVRDAFELA